MLVDVLAWTLSLVYKLHKTMAQRNWYFILVSFHSKQCRETVRMCKLL